MGTPAIALEGVPPATRAEVEHAFTGCDGEPSKVDSQHWSDTGHRAPSGADSASRTAVTIAAHHEKVAQRIQGALQTESFRTYTSVDVIGVEMGGALKNVIAIAAGIADGLGFGLNARSAVITRGLAEISRIAVAMGANPLTLMGLSGLGDLVLTCTGDLSRNRRVGIELGKGRSLEQILADMTQVAEGVKTARSARDLSRKVGVELPICDQVHAIMYEGKSPRRAMVELMTRAPKRED